MNTRLLEKEFHLTVRRVVKGESMANTSLNFTGEGASLDAQPLYQAAALLWKVVPPVLLVCGTFGNVMTIVVMRGMEVRQSAACMPVYFTALAVSDILLSTIGLPRFWLIYVFGFDFRLLSESACKIHMFLVYVFSRTSAWFLVAMTSQRVASVAWPLKVCLQGTRKKALLTVVVIVCLSLLSNSALLFSSSIVVHDETKQCLYAGIHGMFNYMEVFQWFDLAMSSVIPFCILSASNILLLWKVTRSVRAARNMTEPGHVSSRAKKASSLSVTLVTTSAAFLLLTLPVVAYSAYWYSLTVYDFQDTQFAATFTLGYTVSVLLWYCNCSVNFYLYCLSGTKLRNEAKHKLMSVLPKCILRQE